jgi:hypothetical protein
MPSTHSSAITRTALLGAVLLALAGCAVAPAAPVSQLSASRTALDQARMAGAAESVPIEYEAAQRKLANAETAYAAQDYLHATRLAREAEVDAQLAQARTGAIRAQDALAEVQASVRALKDETNRVNQ